MNRPRLTECLFDPFRYVAGWSALGAGLFVLAMIIALCNVSGLAMDGLYQLHYRQAALLQHLMMVVGGWLLLASLLTLAGRLVTRSGFRTLDLFGTLCLARWPMLLLTGILALPRVRATVQRVTEAVRAGETQLPSGETVLLTVVGLASLGLVAWSIQLSWRAYRLSCDVQGRRAGVFFAATVILAEIAASSLAEFVLRSA